MQNESLPTESEIYQQKNLQIEKSCITMNIYGSPSINKNKNVNNEQCNGDINQMEESLVVNNLNKLSLDKVEDNINNYSLTENRNENPAPLNIKKNFIIYNSVNPKKNCIKQGIIIENQDIQQKTENNAITEPIKNSQQIQNHVQAKVDCNPFGICCCILIIILCLALLPFVLLFICICICCGEKKEDEDKNCIPSCFNGICLK